MFRPLEQDEVTSSSSKSTSPISKQAISLQPLLTSKRKLGLSIFGADFPVYQKTVNIQHCPVLRGGRSFLPWCDRIDSLLFIEDSPVTKGTLILLRKHTEMVESDAHLPRLLCLHGGGTSALIFKIQTRRLQWALRSTFKFVFADAPFLSGPGPGVLPAFQGCEPYFRWVIPESTTPEQDQERVRQVLKRVIKEDGGEFVGVLGFSQGGRLTAGLLADQVEGNATEGMPNWKFGVMLCGSYPPLSLSLARSPSTKPSQGIDEHGETREPDEDEIIHIPSVLVRGTLDPHSEKGRRLVKYFDPETAIVLEFVMGHHLPGAAGDTTSDKGDNQRIVDAILKVYAGQLPYDNFKALKATAIQNGNG